MHSSALLMVLTMNCIGVLARPSPGKDGQNSKDFVYKFPTDMLDGLSVTIKGTINTKLTKFTILIAGNNTSEDCDIEYDSEKGVFYRLSEDDSSGEAYDITGTRDTTTFKLILHASNDSLVPTFQANGDGEVVLPVCPILRPDHYKHISFEGIQSIQTLLFEFPTS